MAFRLANQYWTRGEVHGVFRNADGRERVEYGRPKFLDTRSVKISGGVVNRLGDILKKYGLTWECLYQSGWVQKDFYAEVTRRIAKHFADYCQKAAEQYDHPLLAYSSPPRKDSPRIKGALRLGGELAVAALRIRCPSLRLRPDRNVPGRCRYCSKGRENGRHLMVCPDIPPDLLQARIDILSSIQQDSGSWIRPSPYFLADLALSFEWRGVDNSSLKRLLVWCRNMINRYADYVPAWELEQFPQLAAYPVFRVRPRCR